MLERCTAGARKYWDRPTRLLLASAAGRLPEMTGALDAVKQGCFGFAYDYSTVRAAAVAGEDAARS